MRDAVGGSVVIVIIMVFIVLVSAYLAFNVNYMKAFKMKDKIIALYEESDGECLSDCKEKIKTYAKEIGYDVAELNCEGAGYNPIEGLYCEKEVEVENKEKEFSENDMGSSRYYKIMTKIDIRIPIVDNALDIKPFQINGDTKVFTTYNDKE